MSTTLSNSLMATATPAMLYSVPLGGGGGHVPIGGACAIGGGRHVPLGGDVPIGGGASAIGGGACANWGGMCHWGGRHVPLGGDVPIGGGGKCHWGGGGHGPLGVLLMHGHDRC